MGEKWTGGGDIKLIKQETTYCAYKAMQQQMKKLV